MKTTEEKAKAYDIIIEKANKMHSENCEACKACIEELIPELAEFEDEKIKKRITLCLEECVHSDVIRDYEKDECIAWLENIPVTIDHEKREGFHLGYKAGLERLEMKTAAESLGISSYEYNKIVDECIFGEQKPEENKGNIGGISANSAWSEEDEENFCSVYLDVKSARQNTVNSLSGELKEQEQKRMDEVISWLQSLKDRVQPKQELSKEDDGVLLESISVLQNNSHWVLADKLKSLKDRYTWKPSDEQMGCLSDAIEHYNSLGYPAPKLKELLDDLKKLKEVKYENSESIRKSLRRM